MEDNMNSALNQDKVNSGTLEVSEPNLYSFKYVNSVRLDLFDFNDGEMFYKGSQHEAERR